MNGAMIQLYTDLLKNEGFVYESNILEFDTFSILYLRTKNDPFVRVGKVTAVYKGKYFHHEYALY